MRPPTGGLIVLPVYLQINTRVTSPTILGVLAASPEPSVKMRTLCIGYAHTGCHHPRTHPADASAAWRPSPHMAVEPQPHSGALASTAAGAAGRAVETRFAAAAALSHAPGIGAGNRPAAALRAMAGIATRCNRRRGPNDPAAWGYAARSLTTGEIWRTTPPSRPGTPAARPRFSMQIARQVGLGRR
jgi:hypothetical protein